MDFRVRDVTHDGQHGGFTAEWTASGDRFGCGTASTASVRISDKPITPQNFAAATEVATPPPGAPGDNPRALVTGRAVGECLYVALQGTSRAGIKSPVAEALDGPGSCAAIPAVAGITGVSPAVEVPEAPAVNLLLLAALVAVGGWAAARRRRRAIA
jgi:hypothetical protein